MSPINICSWCPRANHIFHICNNQPISLSKLAGYTETANLAMINDGVQQCHLLKPPSSFRSSWRKAKLQLIIWTQFLNFSTFLTNLKWNLVKCSCGWWPTHLIINPPMWQIWKKKNHCIQAIPSDSTPYLQAPEYYSSQNNTDKSNGYKCYLNPIFYNPYTWIRCIN
jgi:hypothetical protein